MGKPAAVSRKTRIILIVCAAVFVAAAAAVLLGVLLTLPKGPSSDAEFGSAFLQTLPRSAEGEMLVAERTDAKRANGQPLYIARSYGGLLWEAIPDLDNEMPNIDCSESGACYMFTQHNYTIHSVDVPQELLNLSPLHLAARLHMQATFGATKEDLTRVAEIYGTNYGSWILDQMRLTPTLARSYFRERANARPGLFELGQETKPCDIGSRWHRYLFESRDKGKSVEISLKAAGSRFVVKIDGVVRGEVDTFMGFPYPGTPTNFTFPVTLQLCTVNEEINGLMTFTANMSTCNVNWRNPTIEYITAGLQTYDESDALLVPVVGARPGSYVLKWRLAPCNNASDAAGNSFMRVGNSTFRFDKRIRFLGNTVEDPATVEATFSGQCPVIVKSYQNRDQCVRRYSCGTSVSFRTATFTLSESILRAWYTKSRRYVYYVTDLRLEEPFDISPCASGNSRWRRVRTGSCPAPTALDATTRATISAALAASTDTNPYVRDITLTGAGCVAGRAAIGAQVEAAGECFQHVHPDLYSVRDFTRWVDIHDGNQQAMAGGNPNPIANFAQTGRINLNFPISHPMQRFYDRRSLIPLVGRYGDEIDFQSLNVELQTEAMAALVGALRTNSDDGAFEACGSPGEISTTSEYGYHYQVTNSNVSAAFTEALEWPMPTQNDHRFVLQNVALKSVDQLRQRIAWSLLNIVVIASQDVELQEYTDAWTSYYDIFARHAFGNYLEVMRDVSYHPLMGSYLSYRGNRAYVVQGTFPDENYAREIMQLFSIGLWRLNDDGTQQYDEDGTPLETYTNADIVDFARVWTGFDRQPYRTNFATYWSNTGSTANVVDPMQVRALWRDRMPKAKLDSGYLGDGYPLCDDLPAQAFLREGARYEYTGTGSVEGDILDKQNVNNSGIRGRFAPTPSSALYQTLCAPSADLNGACTFPLFVVLDSNLPCEGVQECNAQRVLSVTIYDPVANVTRYYAYQGVPCVRLTLFPEGQLLKRSNGRLQCADPVTRVGSPVCCNSTVPTRAASNRTSECLFANDVTDYATTQQRCAAMGLDVCSLALNDAASWSNTCAGNAYMWTNATCNVALQVYGTGQVGIVDPNGLQFKLLSINSNNVFRVRWADDQYPQSDNGTCPEDCMAQVTTEGDSCMCNFTVSSAPVFSQFSDLTRVNDDAVNLLARELVMGAVKPSLQDEGTYTRCDNEQCNALTDVTVWLHKDDNNELSERTVFELPPFRLGGRTRYLLNRVSTVTVGTSFAFRNPPHFTPLLGELTDVAQEWTSDTLWTRKAEYEVEALLEHLFEHDNTGPFIAYRLIQQMVTSNPSPRYMRSVVRAFRTGTHAGVKFSERYGDLGATVYAILMDQEARSPIVEADPTFGMLRDPLLRLYHLMRSLEYKSGKNREVALWDLMNRIGVHPFAAPTVFGFYLPEYRPAGPIEQSGLVGPQVQLATTPNMIGFLNGITSLIDNGLTSCDSGLGVGNNWNGRRCVPTGPHETADGVLSYAPPSNATTEEVIDDLNLLLTAGRLHASTRATLATEFEKIRINETYTPEALRQALKVLVASSEFQTTSYNHITQTERTEPAQITPQGRPFKAIVVIFEYGGCDSYNVIVPHSNCPTKDLYAEYQAVRLGAAINKTQLLQIAVPPGTQPCNTFGIHPAMPQLHSLYNAGDALFAANIGVLVEPVTKDGINKKTARLPPSLFAHNIMQRTVQSVHAQYISAEGVLGRITDALVDNDAPYASALFSLGGNVKMVQGSPVPADFISGGSGVVRLRGLNKIKDALGNITEFTSGSVFAEAYNDQLFYSVQKTEKLFGLLNATQLTATFGKSGLDQQMQQVSKLIKSLPAETGVERVMFFTQTGGFDTHDTFNLNPVLGTVDAALGSFAEEMKAQGKWDDVVVISVSDFARTLSNNGRGTDHGWGGNHFVAGGSVKGGQILGSYPTSLTDDSELSLGRGRMIPTTSFEAVWKGIAEWFGVAPEQISSVLPNAPNFPEDQLFGQAKMFK